MSTQKSLPKRKNEDAEDNLSDIDNTDDFKIKKSRNSESELKTESREEEFLFSTSDDNDELSNKNNEDENYVSLNRESILNTNEESNSNITLDKNAENQEIAIKTNNEEENKSFENQEIAVKTNNEEENKSFDQDSKFVLSILGLDSYDPGEPEDEEENLDEQNQKVDDDNDDNDNNEIEEAESSSDENEDLNTENFQEKPSKNYYTNIERSFIVDKKKLFEKFAKVANEEIKDESVIRETQPAAWVDSDDEDYTVGDVKKKTKYSGPSYDLKKNKNYKEYLEKLAKTNGTPKWADLNRDVESPDKLLTKAFTRNFHDTILSANTIEIKRLKDLNYSASSKGCITNVVFHPKSTVVLFTTDSGIASLYSVEGKKVFNTLLTNFSIKCAKICNDGFEMILGSHKKFFYTIDLMTGNSKRVFLPNNITKFTLFELSPCEKYIAASGRFGEIHLFDAKSKELIHSYKQENTCTGMQFTTDSNKLITSSDSSDVTIFDMKQRKIQHWFIDDGCIHGKVIAISTNNQILATGSDEGIVNVYDYNKVLNQKYPQPEKVIKNLTTSINCLKFNHSSEILGYSSGLHSNAFKLVHFPSLTVYSNFPYQNSNIGYINSFDFSPNSSYMAIGNREGSVPLFKLNHFKNY